jgi:hypothetical protein
MPDKNVDKPDSLAFIQAIAAQLPDAEQSRRNLRGIVLPYVAGKYIAHVAKRPRA